MSAIPQRDFRAVSRFEHCTEVGVSAPVFANVDAHASVDVLRAPEVLSARPRHSGPRAIALIPSREMSPLGGRVKRAFDIAIVSVALLLLAPLLLAIAASLKLSGGGDIIYRHRRVGFGGRHFFCLKFRTMVPNGDELLRRHFEQNPRALAEWRTTRKLVNDPRVTPIGSFLRKTSLDELPQLFNILRGEMSCVGPRPIVFDELPFYGTNAKEYFGARPGITGLWQVSGRSQATYPERVKYDLLYLREWSLVRDIVIIARTVPAVLKTEQAF